MEGGVMANQKYSQETADLINRMCRNVERLDFVLEKNEAEETILKTYDLFNLPRPEKVIWLKDIFDEKFQNSAMSARSASSAWSAWSAWSARSASSAWSAWSASSASSAWSASSASSAWSAWSASSASSASSAMSALDYDFDYYIFGYEYVRSETDANEHDHKYLGYCELLMQAKEYGLGYRVEWENTLYLVPTPLVRLNSQNQFHSDEMAAIRWKDGEEFYYLNAVNFPHDLFKKVTSGTMPFQDILAIEDIDQRTQAMRFGSVTDFLKHANAVKLDSYQKQTPDGNPVDYALYKIPQGDIFTEDAYYMVYSCPSTHKLYMSGVEKLSTVKEACAWKMSTDQFPVSPDAWEAMVPLEHES